MPIKKQQLKSKPQVKITFEVAKEEALDAESIVLLSEHNNWAAIQLKKFKNGKFKVVENISTEGSNSFQFTYRATAEDGGEYTIFPSGADGAADNGMNDGGQNAVLNLV